MNILDKFYRKCKHRVMDKIKLAAIIFFVSVTLMVASGIVSKQEYYFASLFFFLAGMFGVYFSIFLVYMSEITDPTYQVIQRPVVQNIEYNTQNTQNIHNYSHRYDTVSEGVEVTESFNDGRIVTTRHIKRWN